jgi:thioredoxin reductase
MAENVVESDYTSFGTLKVAQPAALPDVLDVFVAGGGPAGTAAAVRAKEFGLSCLVVDYDDLMKRIRDYPKEKLIKPNYGGGDKLQFPVGGPMLNSLHFDDLDKDEMVVQWKAKYKEYALSARIGAEFTGLSRGADGIWDVKIWSHRAGKEMTYRARHVILAIGAGVPRRFDIPGNTEGLAFRLDDAAAYVGQPALVIGGGTSAAEAVISISNAKVKGEDETAVYWSYRGDKMPKVSKALSEVFFDAYVGNGNIRYLAFSEPVAVVTGPDKQDYLSVRIDRKTADKRPTETVNLEFLKSQVVACIGEDLPIRLLQGCNVKVPSVNNRPLMLVNHDGEVSLPGVFLVGDARGPKFLRCTDFNDSNTYETITLKRNIKAAMVHADQVHVDSILERLRR